MGVTDKRTQLYLTAAQHEALIRAARKRRTSLAEVVREAIAEYLGKPGKRGRAASSTDPLAEFIGCFEGPGDLAERHDDFLYGPRTDRAPKEPKRSRPRR